MMKEKEEKRVPKLRFPEFTDDWEQRKLEKLSDFITKGATPTTYGFEWQLSGIPFFRNDAIKDNKFVYGDYSYISEEANEALKRSEIHADDILIAITGDIGKVGIIPKTVKKGNINQHTARVRIIKEALPYFVYQSLATEAQQRKYQLIKTGLSMPQLSLEQIRETIVLCPAVEEQAKIGAYFKHLDHLITLHQRKFEKLTNVKKSMLEKMFPQNGSSYPEIRFKGFTDPWEQRKLGDIADIVGGGTPSTGNQSYWDGDIDWYAPAEIADQIYANSSQKKITGLGYENSSAKMLPPGTVLFTSRAGIGKTAILTRKGCTNQGFQSIVPHRGELDSYFIFSRTGELKRYGELVGAGSTFVEVSGKQMAVMELMMPPTMREQQTIGGFFQQLDHLITLHQRELEKLQNIKKSMLEKMFV